MWTQPFPPENGAGTLIASSRGTDVIRNRMNQVNNECDTINDTTRQARITTKKPIEADKNSSDKQGIMYGIFSAILETFESKGHIIQIHSKFEPRQKIQSQDLCIENQKTYLEDTHIAGKGMLQTTVTISSNKNIEKTAAQCKQNFKAHNVTACIPLIDSTRMAHSTTARTSKEKDN